MQLENLKDGHLGCFICQVPQYRVPNTSTAQVYQRWLEAVSEAIVHCVHKLMPEEYVQLCHQTTCTSLRLHNVGLTSSYEHCIIPAVDSYDIPNSNCTVMRARMIQRHIVTFISTFDHDTNLNIAHQPSYILCTQDLKDRAGCC